MPRAAEVKEPAVTQKRGNTPEKDDASHGDSHGSPGSPGFGDVRMVRRRGHIQFAALCFCLFMIGYLDGMSPPLFPWLLS